MTFRHGTDIMHMIPNDGPLSAKSDPTSQFAGYGPAISVMHTERSFRQITKTEHQKGIQQEKNKQINFFSSAGSFAKLFEAVAFESGLWLACLHQLSEDHHHLLCNSRTNHHVRALFINELSVTRDTPAGL